MKRSPIVRLQIFLLLIVAGLLVWRSTRSPSGPVEGGVGLSDLETGQLYRRSFELARDGRVRVAVVGSTESEIGATLAAYPWIVRHDDRSLAWSLDPASSVRERTLVRATDTLALRAGAYDLYFTTFGHTMWSREGTGFLRLKPHWSNEESNWSAHLTAVDSVGLTERSEFAAPDVADDVLWNSRSDGHYGESSVIFIVGPGASPTVRGVASICESGCDALRIERIDSGQTVWTMDQSGTAAAGGAVMNRLVDATIPLEPGIYRLNIESGYEHGYGDWRANPPTDPEAWGVHLVRTEGISAFDPWTDRQPLVAMLGVSDDQLLRTVIQVDRPTLVYVEAMGELMSGGSRYDYGWIQSADDRSRVWEQQYDESAGAGGDDSNRLSTKFIELAPGRYSVYYQSDGSHSYGSFNRSEPDHPERWGIALFVVNGEGEGVTVVEAQRDAHEEVAADTVVDALIVEPPPPIPPIAGEVLFGAVAVRNDSHQSGSFALPRSTRIRIVAVGEMTRSGRYDYGWIESESGDVVWEQSMSNTTRAGGDDRNRLFDGVITLPAGSYVAHFQTDFSHAFGDFDSGAPSDPGSWGMRIVRMPE